MNVIISTDRPLDKVIISCDNPSILEIINPDFKTIKVSCFRDGRDGATGPAGLPGATGATGGQGPIGPTGPGVTCSDLVNCPVIIDIQSDIEGAYGEIQTLYNNQFNIFQDIIGITTSLVSITQSIIDLQLEDINLQDQIDNISGSTNLGYIGSTQSGIITSDTGTDATIPPSSSTQSGLMITDDKDKLDSLFLPTGLEKIGVGWRLIGKDPTRYLTLGSNAVDLSNNTSMFVPSGPSGARAFTIGNRTIANGSDSMAMGFNSKASGSKSFAGGEESITSGGNSISFGYRNGASGDNSVAMGFQCDASGGNSVAMGEDSTATGIGSLAFNSATTNGNYGVGMGYGNTSEAQSEVVIGEFAEEVPGTPDNTIATDTVFRIGVGYQDVLFDIIRRDAFQVYKNGMLKISPATQSSITNGTTASIIYNISTSRLNIHNGSTWQEVSYLSDGVLGATGATGANGATGATGPSVWGGITGTLSLQTDLQSELYNRILVSNGSFTGILTGTGSTLTGTQAIGILDLKQTWNTTGNPTAIKLNVTNTASSVSSLLLDLQINSTSRFKVNSSGFITCFGISAPSSDITSKYVGASNGIPNGYSAAFQAFGTAFAHTSGNKNTYVEEMSWSPTSGTGTKNAYGFIGTINQTGTATGISRGLYINPTLTSAADFRGIEISKGSIAFPYQEASTTYAIKNNDYLINATSGTFTATLPTAVGCAGRIYVVKNSGAGVITIATTSSQTIDGSKTRKLSTQYSTATLMSDGDNWIVTATL